METTTKKKTGRKPHPQKNRTHLALNKQGQLTTIPYLKKVVVEMPSPIVEQIKAKAHEHGHTTMVDFIRHILFTHPDVGMGEADKYVDPAKWALDLWAPPKRTLVSGAITEAVESHTAKRRLVR